MPKELTHWIVADRAASALPLTNPLLALIRDNRECYLCGAVLPDTLLHLFRGEHAPGALRLANRFHDASGNSFEPLIKADKQADGKLSAPILACLMGVISHIQTDSVFHPFVYAVAGAKNIGLHYRIETELDILFFQAGITPPAFLLKELVTPSVKEVLYSVSRMLFDPDDTLPASAHHAALSLHCRCQALYDRAPWKLAAIILATLAGNPFRQQRHLFYPFRKLTARLHSVRDITSWKHPVTGIFSDALPEVLLNEAIKKTSMVYETIGDCSPLADALSITPGANLLTGIPGVLAESMKSEGV